MSRGPLVPEKKEREIDHTDLNPAPLPKPLKKSHAHADLPVAAVCAATRLTLVVLSQHEPVEMPYVCAPLSTLMSRTGCMLRFVRSGPLGMRGRSQLVSNGNGSPWASAGLLHLQISGRTARAGSLGRQSSVGGEQGRGAGPPGHDAGAQLLLLPASARRVLASADGAANGGRERGQEIWRRRCILLNGIPIGTVC